MTQFSGVVKVQTDSNAASVLIYSEDYGIHLILAGTAARSFIEQRQMKKLHKAYFKAETNTDGVLILEDQVDDRDW